MTSFAVAFFISMLVAAALTPLVLKFALRFDLYDAPGDRKIHARPIPRLGGIAIVVAFFAPVTGLLLVDAGASYWLASVENHVIGLFVGGILIALLGVYDDIKSSNAIQKLVVQVGVACLMFALDYRIAAISNPFGSGVIEFGALSLPVTVLWFVGVINAVNLIDGLDGLAGGIGLISVSTLFAISVMDGNILAALFCACLAGSLVGFLFFNFNPARIFMGDTGSLFLGFVLAAFSISTSSKGTTTVALVVPALALGLPIVDTLLAIGRRVRNNKPIFSADQDHIHHKLLRAGLSHRQAVLILYAVAVVLAGAALLLRVTTDLTSGLVLLLIAVLLFALFRLLVARSYAVLNLADPFDGRIAVQRAQLAELAADLDAAPSAQAVAALVERLAKATDVLAVAICERDETLFTWSRQIVARDAVRGMKLYQIPLRSPDQGQGREVVLHLQFTDGEPPRDLAVVVPWELMARPLASALSRFEWEPLCRSRPEKPATVRSLVAIPGVLLAEPTPDARTRRTNR